MGRPSKSRSAGDMTTSVNDTVNTPLTSPVNLSFHPSASATRDGQQGPAADDGPRNRDVSSQQPDSTVERCTLMSVCVKRASTCGNVLRQLQSPSGTKTVVERGKQSTSSSTSLWPEGGENMALLDGGVCVVDRSRWSADVGAADLRVKRARYSGVQSPVSEVQSLGDITAIGRRWSHEAGEDAAMYETAVGSPSVTSSGCRDDDDEAAVDSEPPWMRSCTSPSADLWRHRRRGSLEQLDKKQTG